MPNEEIIALLEAQRTTHQECIDPYKQIPLPALDQLTQDRELTSQRLTLELGFRVEQAYLDWLELAIATVRSLPERH